MRSRRSHVVTNASNLPQDFLQPLRGQYAFTPCQKLIGIRVGDSIAHGCVEDTEPTFQLPRQESRFTFLPPFLPPLLPPFLLPPSPSCRPFSSLPPATAQSSL